MDQILCTHCTNFFSSSPRHRNQMYCPEPECQKARKAAWQRNKMKTDKEYRFNQKLGNRKWLDATPGYWKEYRRKNPKKVERNRILQSVRNKGRSGKKGPKAKMDASLIAKMDSSKHRKHKMVGQFWLVPVIAKMDVSRVNIIEISNSYE